MAAELRRLRTDAQLSRDDVEERTGVNEGTLYRVETARSKPQRRTLVALLDLYQADDALRQDLFAIARTADDQGWLRPYHSELPEDYAAYISFEAEATRIRNCQSLFVPGLLQTEDYARAVIRGTLPTATQTAVEQRVQARIERQERVSGESPFELWAIMDEAAIRRLVGGPAVMHSQLAHLLKASDQPNVTIQVIPYDAGAHPGMPGSFVYMEFGEPNPDLVYVDTLAGDLFLETDTDLALYAFIFDHLRAAALSLARTAELISSLTREIEKR
jgi:transcriptional regulator with XRE-family HTH domain